MSALSFTKLLSSASILSFSYVCLHSDSITFCFLKDHMIIPLLYLLIAYINIVVSFLKEMVPLTPSSTLVMLSLLLFFFY